MKKPQTKKSGTRAKTPKADKKKTPKPAPAAAAKAAVGHNSADPKLRELFLQHKPKVDRLKEELSRAQGKYRAALKDAKGDGFTKDQFDVARQLSTPEGEQEVRVELSKLTATAMYVGSDLGGLLGQLELFAPSTTDASERAYDEGQKASMENKQAKPDYAPGTAQYESYMKGFHDHQEGISGGFQSTDKGAKTRTEKNRAAKAGKGGEEKPTEPEQPKDEPTEQPSEPSPAASGQHLSRAEFNRMQEQAQQQSQFSKAN